VRHETEILSEFLFHFLGRAEPEPLPCAPPEPDLFCARGKFADSYFELARILDPQSVRVEIELRKNGYLLNPSFSGQGWPERDVLEKKLAKRYETEGRPVHLLLYWEWVGGDALTANAPPPWSVPFCVMASELLLPSVMRASHPFKTIFYFDRYTTRALWSCGAV
jgi:hypothetical protein